MSLTNIVSFEQVKSKKEKRQLCCNLRQALKVINSEYQRIDWEDRDFLNNVLNEILESLEISEEIYADN